MGAKTSRPSARSAGRTARRACCPSSWTTRARRPRSCWSRSGVCRGRAGRRVRSRRFFRAGETGGRAAGSGPGGPARERAENGYGRASPGQSGGGALRPGGGLERRRDSGGGRRRRHRTWRGMRARDAFAHRGKIRRRASLQESQPGKQNEFFIDGVHDNILTSLANISQLQAVSRTSGVEYRRTKKKIPRTARERDVACVPEGSVRSGGNTVRITGQLIRATTDQHVWAGQFALSSIRRRGFAVSPFFDVYGVADRTRQAEKCDRLRARRAQRGRCVVRDGPNSAFQGTRCGSTEPCPPAANAEHCPGAVAGSRHRVTTNAAVTSTAVSPASITRARSLSFALP